MLTKLLATGVLAVALSAAAESKTAEQAFKNITELKGTPADQLMPAMQFISSALGVECSFCHVPGKMDLDDKPAKKTAREMIAMTAAINKNSFNGRRELTCYSCHHGAAHPSSTPPVMMSDATPAPATPTPTAAQPTTAEMVLQKFVAALGGEDAIRKITSRVQTGTIFAMGNTTPIELYTKAPNKRVSITKMPNGESYTAFDGTAGWMGNTGRPAREMTAAESAASAIDAEFYLALRLPKMFEQLRVGRPEQIGASDCDTIIATSPGSAPVRFSFDKSSGMLVRVTRYAETPLGRNPTQIDYSDYRVVDGVKTPFRWTLSRPNGRFTIQVLEVKTNVAIDDAKFARPAGEIGK